MLVLSRRHGERTFIDIDDATAIIVTVTPDRDRAGRVKLAIQAPRRVAVRREENMAPDEIATGEWRARTEGT